MKKLTLLGATFALLCSAGQVQAQEVDYSSNTSTEIFDFTPWNDDKLLKLFAKAADEGRQYPTKEEFEAAGFNIDLEFSRSHVRPATIMEDASKNVNPEVYPTRRLWMNIPTGQGDGIGGYPSDEFNDDVYSMWQYTNLFGAWNHSVLQAPGSWADAAHKNGTHMFSGIKFFESWGTTSDAYTNLIMTKNSDGTYRYVDAFLNALRFLGLDGINYNFEDRGYTKEDVIGFHQALYRRAAEIGFDSFHIGMYTSSSNLTMNNARAAFGTLATGKTADLMLNYSGGSFSYQMEASVNNAEQAMGTAEGLYAGCWISFLDGRGFDRLSENETVKKCGICLWGEHKVSRLFQYTVGNSLMDIQTNYQTMQERFFSGQYRTPIRRPAISSSGYKFQVSVSEGIDNQLIGFPGMASYVPERTAIQGDLPFNTHFTLGNGDFYAYKGKTTNGSWYNMGQQDYVPTYRWLLYQPNTTNESTALNVAFTHTDAYIGGTALSLTSSNTGAGTDLVLYRAKLNVTGANPKAKVALKSGVEGTTAANLSVIVKKFDDNTWLEFPLADVEGANWQEQEVAMSGLAQNDVIEYIGFRVKGSVDNYKMLVGKLMLCDDRAAVTPANIDEESILAEVKAETSSSMSVKLTWEVDATGFAPALKDWGMIYNDEVNIDHFEIFYKNGEEGRVSEVGRTSTWSALISNIQFEGETDDPYIGVRAVSIDMKTYSPIVWVNIARGDGDLPQADNSSYPATYLDTASDNYEVAQHGRYLDKVTTTGAIQNLDYTRDKAVGDDNYVYENEHVLKVEQGQQIELFLRGATVNTTQWHPEGASNDCIHYCYGIGYVDWDMNNEFDGTSDEKVLEIGSLNSGTAAVQNPGVTFNITVPADAAIGITRLRMVFSDAWFPHPGPAGATNKGFSIDFPVEISGSNTPREPEASYKEFLDKGEADEPDGLKKEEPVEPGVGIDEVESAVSSMYLSDDVIYFNNVEKAWIYTAEGRFIKFVNPAPETLNVSDLTPGVYVVKMQNGKVVRGQKMVKN